jgi:hypothetical protein
MIAGSPSTGRQRRALGVVGEQCAAGHAGRIDVTDMGSSGSNDSYGIILDTGYVSGQKQLRGGNVTIHK